MELLEKYNGSVTYNNERLGLLEKNNDWLSDATYLAFRYFMTSIVPEFFSDALNNNRKTIYIPIHNREDGVYIGNHYLGQVDYFEFINYIYRLPAFKGYRLKNSTKIIEEYMAPFDFEELVYNYYEDLQREDYPIYKESCGYCNSSTATSYDFDSFIKMLLENIIRDAIAGKCRMSEILDADGETAISRIIYLSLEIRNDEFFIDDINLGRVDVAQVIKFLTSLSCFCGQFRSDESFELSFDLNGLINFCYSESVSR